MRFGIALTFLLFAGCAAAATDPTGRDGGLLDVDAGDDAPDDAGVDAFTEGGVDAPGAEDLGAATCDSLPVPVDASPTSWAIVAPVACQACPDSYFSGSDFVIRREAPLMAAPDPLLEGAFTWQGVTTSPEGARLTLLGDDEASVLLPFVDAADLAWVPEGLPVEAALLLDPARVGEGANRGPRYVRGEWTLADETGRVIVRAFFESNGGVLSLPDARLEEIETREPVFDAAPYRILWDGHQIVGGDAVACQEDNSPLGRHHVRGVLVLTPDGERLQAPFGESVELELDGAPARLRGTFRTCYLVPEDRGSPPVGTGFCSRAGGAEVLAVRLAP